MESVAMYDDVRPQLEPMLSAAGEQGALQLAMFKDNFGLALCRNREHTRAVQLCKEALALFVSSVGHGHNATRMCRNNLAYTEARPATKPRLGLHSAHS